MHAPYAAFGVEEELGFGNRGLFFPYSSGSCRLGFGGLAFPVVVGLGAAGGPCKGCNSTAGDEAGSGIALLDDFGFVVASCDSEVVSSGEEEDGFRGLGAGGLGEVEGVACVFG